MADTDDKELYTLGKQLRFSIEKLVVLEGLRDTAKRVNNILTEIEKAGSEQQLIQCPRGGCKRLTNALAQQSRKVKFAGQWTCPDCGYSFPPDKWIWLVPGAVPENIKEFV